MKATVNVIVTAIALALFIGVPLASETATQDECMAKCKAAARLVAEKGKAQALEQLNDGSGAFVWKDTYVFALDADTATVVAHPIKPKLVGKMLTGMKDVNGKMFFAEFLNTANEHGEGWVDYMWPRPGAKKPVPKQTYVYKVPGESVIMAAGVYK